MKTPRPSPLSRTLALVPPAIALVAQQASGAFGTFIKIGDIKGESVDDKHAEWIDVQSFQWGVERKISLVAGTPDREASTPSVSEITITKNLDSASPALFLNAVGGTPAIPTVTLALQDQTTRTVFYRFTLSDVMISSQSGNGAAGDSKPSESISLNFTKIKIEYFARDPKGGLTAIPAVTYDLATAKSSQ